MELFYSKDISCGTVRLDRDESAHCVRVLRHRSGDAISVIDGEGSLYRCRLTAADANAAEAEIIETVPGFGALPYELTMAVCPTKNIDRYEWFVEKATEIGVAAVAPVLGDHSERKIIKPERLERIALSAAKQSLKGRVPRIMPLQTIRDFIGSVPDGALKMVAYCDETLERDKRLSVRDALRSRREGCREVYVLIGPEGDFSPEEVALALNNGWVPVHLGDSRLRTETAALTATAAVYLEFLACE